MLGLRPPGVCHDRRRGGRKTLIITWRDVGRVAVCHGRLSLTTRRHLLVPRSRFRRKRMAPRRPGSRGDLSPKSDPRRHRAFPVRKWRACVDLFRGRCAGRLGTASRRLGVYLISQTMERLPEIGFKSYDRFFPSQDTMPSGGFGNLIALPLQGRARSAGNSVFVDEALAPHPDQWAFLAPLRGLG